MNISFNLILQGFKKRVKGLKKGLVKLHIKGNILAKGYAELTNGSSVLHSSHRLNFFGGID